MGKTKRKEGEREEGGRGRKREECGRAMEKEGGRREGVTERHKMFVYITEGNTGKKTEELQLIHNEGDVTLFPDRN